MDELLAEIMRRVEDRWGDGAYEGPYARQEIVEGVREILAELKAEATQITGRAADLVMDELAREASAQVDLVDAQPPTAIEWPAGIDPAANWQLVASYEYHAPMCRCSVLPLEP